MRLQAIGATEIGGIVGQHHTSLPRWADHTGITYHLPWLSVFIGAPTVAAVGLQFAEVSPANVSGGLLAGIGVLGGLLFQVLAWVSSRIGAIADGMDGAAATPSQIQLVGRLDVARANIAYATLVSIVLVMELGIASMLAETPAWVSGVSSFLLLHLGLTLVLVLVRVNRIGRSDRVVALTAHARH